MQKIAVLTCSNSGLDYIKHPYKIPILRSVVTFGDQEMYRDYVDLRADAFYNRLREDKNAFPKTSYVPVGDMVEIFESLGLNGYSDIIVITISSHLSGLFEAVKLASEMVDSVKVHRFDSKTIAFPEAYMALEAARMVDEEQSIKAIMKHLETIRANNKIYFAVDTLEYLIKNGRLSKIQGTMAALLKIKPLLMITPEGKVDVIEKIRTTRKAIDRVIGKYLEETEGKDVLTFISHAHNESAVAYIRAKLVEARPDIHVQDYYLTPVVGAHAGPNAVGLGYIHIKK